MLKHMFSRITVSSALRATTFVVFMVVLFLLDPSALEWWRATAVVSVAIVIFLLLDSPTSHSPGLGYLIVRGAFAAIIFTGVLKLADPDKSMPFSEAAFMTIMIVVLTIWNGVVGYIKGLPR